MTWIDFVLIVFIGLMIYGGTKRGLIPEFFDIIIYSFGVLIIFAVYMPVAGLFVKHLHWGEDLARIFSYFLLFAPLLALLFLIGLLINRSIETKIPKTLNETLGGIFCFFKTIFLIFILLVSVSCLPQEVLVKETRTTLAKSFTVRSIQGLTPAAVDLVGAVTSGTVKQGLTKRLQISVFKK